MASLDRPSIVELLGRLGDENEQTVVQAARELHAKVAQSGLTWDDLLRTEAEIAGADAEAQEVSSDASLDATSDADRSAETGGEPSAADKAEAARLIERLLARKNLSSTLREDLADLKGTIVDGTFDATDSRYVRALAKRLGV
jgi:hypothetical protein